MFLHYEVSNKRKSVVRRSYPLTIFLVSSFGLGRRAKAEGKQLGRPRIRRRWYFISLDPQSA